MNAPHTLWLCALALLLPLLLGAPARLLAEAPVTADDVNRLLEEVQSSRLTDEQKSELGGKLDKAQYQLQRETEQQSLADQYRNAIDNAPREVSRHLEQLSAARANPPGHEDLLEPGATVQDIDSRIALLQAQRQALADRRSQLLDDINGWPERRAAIQQRLVELKGQYEENLTLAQAPADNLEQRVVRVAARARGQAMLAEQQSLQQEMLSKPSRLEINSAERDRVAQALADTDLQLQVLNEAAEAARASLTEETLETTAALKQEMGDLSPALQAYADQNQQLARQLKVYAQELEQARASGEETQAQLDEIQQESSLMHRRLEVAGRKDTLGRVMITRLDKLPNTDQIRRDIHARNDLIATRSLDHIDADEELRAISSRQRYIEVHMPTVDLADDTSSERVTQLIDQRKQLLQTNNESVKALLRSLVENNETAGNLITVTDNFHRFLVGNLMWVRNFGYINVKTFSAQVGALLSPLHWASIPGELRRGYLQHSWSAALLLLWGLVLVLRRPLKKLYDERIVQPALLNAGTLWNIILCLVLSLAIALPGPLALFIGGFFLAAAQPNTEFVGALAPALNFTAFTLFVLLVTRLLLRPLGVGRRFLKWDSRILDSLRRELDWAGPVAILAMFTDIFAINLDVVASGGPLGATATTVIALTLIVFCLRLLRQDIFFGDRTLKIALRLIVLLAAMIILMQLLGLLFAAEIYLEVLCLSILSLLVIKTLSDVLQRALLILRARLERKAKDEIRALEAEGEEDAGQVEDRVDMVYLSEAHTKLLNLVRLVAITVVLWLIWSPSLPAFNLLESVPLWQVSDGTGAEGALRTISLFDLMLGVIIIIVTALIAKHLPSLVQLFLLEWVNISAGARYASSILMQYVVVAMGGSMFLTTVGWEWSNLQWLVAALGVGIGFGLQEIVANFISGIIILFEQPIRVGDIISAGGAEGAVKKISARATVIQTFDGKEHLIPNKELITGQVINWSLTENAVRVVIPVGIAYGSDVRRAMEILVESAKEVELVLSEPEPRATFEDFGDNALLLWLRCYVAEDRPGAWTELRTRINDRFKEAGIVIAFPQRDLHLDFSEALKVEIGGTAADS